MKTFIKECRWGTFLLLRGDLISQIADIYGEWCELEVELFRQLLDNNSNVIEVGSNIGMHAVPVAQFIPEGKLFCFEPQRILFQLLCANAALNNLTNVHAFHAGAGSSNTRQPIAATDYSRPWNYGAFSLADGFSTEQAYAGPAWTESVDIHRLDDHPATGTLDSLSLLKIDAEGMEIPVLEGAQQLIERHRPALFLENNKTGTGDALIHHVNELGYRCFWYGVERADAENYNQVAVKIPGGDLSMICFSEDRVPAGLTLTPAESMADIEAGKVQWITRATLAGLGEA